jgi:hypothetical protein
MQAPVQFKLTPRGPDAMTYGVSRTGRSCFEMARVAGWSECSRPRLERWPCAAFSSGSPALIKDNLQYWIATPPFRLLRVGQISPLRM